MASQTAREYIESQQQLEAEAREALPYQFDTCTQPLGSIRQSLFSCLTCNPSSNNRTETYQAAGICYSCSISCHGEHDLVELFSRRNFTCDCGTSRVQSGLPCTLRINPATGLKGGISNADAEARNTYNHNFENRFCGCDQLYDAHSEKRTMFQCLGLGTGVGGGCGEDWWHAECLLEGTKDCSENAIGSGERGGAGDAVADTVGEIPANSLPCKEDHNIEFTTQPITNVPDSLRDDTIGRSEAMDTTLPPEFPAEDDFEHLICYKCTSAFPWIINYAGRPGFLAAIPHVGRLTGSGKPQTPSGVQISNLGTNEGAAKEGNRKRKAVDGEDEAVTERSPKRRPSSPARRLSPPAISCKRPKGMKASLHLVSLFLTAEFRDAICRCPACFPLLIGHPPLLDEEETYEPPLSASSGSETGNAEPGARSAGSRSLLERGEAALSNMDRVRAIEGVMAYNQLRDKVKYFLKPFAETGTEVGAEDIKRYFEKLRGDEEAIRDAANARAMEQGGVDDGGGGPGRGKGEF